MNLEKLRDFRNRPFDKAASNLAYIGAEAVLPGILTLGSIFRTFEGIAGVRDWEQVFLSYLYAGAACITSIHIASRVETEARQHNFIVGLGDENTENTPPPQPPTGGTF